MKKLLYIIILLIHSEINCQPTPQFINQIKNIQTTINLNLKNDELLRSIDEKSMINFNKAINKINLNNVSTIQLTDKTKFSTNCIYLAYAIINSVSNNDIKNLAFHLKCIQKLCSLYIADENYIKLITKINEKNSESTFNILHFAIFHEVNPKILEILLKTLKPFKIHDKDCKCNKIVIDIKNNYNFITIRMSQSYQDYLGMSRVNNLINLDCTQILLTDFAKLFNSPEYIPIILKYSKTDQFKLI